MNMMRFMSELRRARRTLVMGILNITPDSFSDGGEYDSAEAALLKARQMVMDGVDIIDIGAESTRPGADEIDPETEWRRLEPVLRAITAEVVVPISIDTYHVSTAKRAIALGANIINDVSGAVDPAMGALIRDAGVPYVYMHNRRHIEPSLSVDTFVAEMKRGLHRLLDIGVHSSQIIADPGVGFGKTHAQNLACIRSVDRFSQLGYPVLLGTSRKRVIGQVLQKPVDDRLEGSLATVAYASLRNVRIVRVHDVRETVSLCRMLEAISGDTNASFA